MFEEQEQKAKELVGKAHEKADQKADAWLTQGYDWAKASKWTAFILLGAAVVFAFFVYL